MLIEDYIKGVLDEIETLKQRNRKTLYRMNDTVTDEIIRQAEEYLRGLGYTVETKKCTRYEESWDLMVMFGN